MPAWPRRRSIPRSMPPTCSTSIAPRIRARTNSIAPRFRFPGGDAPDIDHDQRPDCDQRDRTDELVERGKAPAEPASSTGQRGDPDRGARRGPDQELRSEEHTSELQSLMRNSYAVFCLKKKIIHNSSIYNKSTDH